MNQLAVLKLNATTFLTPALFIPVSGLRLIRVQRTRRTMHNENTMLIRRDITCPDDPKPSYPKRVGRPKLARPSFFL